MSSKPRIVAVCGDPGGANAVSPVIALLREEGKVSVDAYAYLQAVELWSGRGIKFEAIPGDASDDAIRSRLSQPRADLLLAGTSVNRFELEKRFVAIAREQGIPSLGVLDFWSNYALRFNDQAGRLRYLPDRVAVMDALARDEMTGAGMPAASIVITGHPGLDGLDAFRQAFSSDRRDAIRQSLGVTGAGRLILYASQPPTFSEQDDAVPPPWHDRLRTVRVLLDAMAGDRSARRGATLLIRPHPRENSGIYRGLRDDAVRVVVSGEGDTRELALSADAVVGMNTMFLVEARHLGRPTLSVRLDLPFPEDFPPNRSGLIRAVYREADVPAALAELLSMPADRLPLPEARGNAGRNVAQLLYSMLKE